MRVLIVFCTIWLLRDVEASAQDHGVKVAEQYFDLPTRTEITNDDIPFILSRRSPLPKPPVSNQDVSRQHASSSQQNRPTGSSRSPGRDSPVATRTSPNNSNDQIPRQRESRPTNRNSGTLRDLIRSESPPRERRHKQWRLSSSSPPQARRIDCKKHRCEHSTGQPRAKTILGMVGPGYISHRQSTGEYPYVVVPPKKAAIREVEHPTIAILTGKVFSQGTMLAGATGVKAVASLSLKQGRGRTLLTNGSARLLEDHDPQTKAEYWLKQESRQRNPVSAEISMSGGGAATVIACNDPNWCNEVWEEGDHRSSE